MIVQKYHEVNTSLHTCFINYSKAFDCVNHEGLWSALKEMHFDPEITLLSRSAKDNNLPVGIWNNRIISTITKGMRQGCILSPHLYSKYTAGIMREVEHGHSNEEYDEPALQGLPI